MDWNEYFSTDMDWAAADVRDLVTALARPCNNGMTFADAEEALRQKSEWGTSAAMWAGIAEPHGDSDGTPQWAVMAIAETSLPQADLQQEPCRLRLGSILINYHTR